jgi:transcriptional regulator with XRE-family HTH domain
LRRTLRRAVNQLQVLIKQQLADHGWSYGDVARRGGLPRSTVHNLATRNRFVRPPNPDTLARLAEGLQLPVQLLREGAAAAVGLHVHEEQDADPERRVLIASIEQLSGQERRHVIALINSLLSARPTAPATPSIRTTATSMGRQPPRDPAAAGVDRPASRPSHRSGTGPGDISVVERSASKAAVQRADE